MRISLPNLRTAMDAQSVSKSELARRSGVSRGVIHGVLRDTAKQVRQETVRKLATALNLSSERLALGGVSDSYRGWMVDQHKSLDFRGLGVGKLHPVPLRDLFVPTEVKEQHSGETDQCEQSGGDRVGTQAHEPFPERVEFQQAVRQYDRILLVGDPGSGKTTLLRNLAAVSAASQRDDTQSADAARIPVFVRLASYSRAKDREGSLDLVDFVAACMRQDGHPDPEQVLREELEGGNCIVLLDGLDEVAGGRQNAEVARCLKRFLRECPNNRFVITARQIAFDSKPWKQLGFRRLQVAPWDDGQIRRFVEKWYHTNASGASEAVQRDATKRADRLIDAIMDNPRVRAIGTNPLILTILAALHHGQGVLPRRRAELYAKLVETLLESWEAAKFSARPGDFLDGTALEGREYGWLLGHLALEMQQNDLTVVPSWWLTDHVQIFLREELGFEVEQAKSECDRVIRYLGERSGLLMERGRGLYAFWHLTFQEYFVARAVLQEAATQPKRSLVDILRPFFHHPRWTEVIPLVAAQLTPAQAPALLRAILDDPDPVGRFLHRGPLLALGCLADGAVVGESELLDQVFGSVLDLGKSRWLGITFDALGVLQHFEGTRLASRARTTISELLASAKDRLSSRETFQLRQVGDEDFSRRMADALGAHMKGQPTLGARGSIDFEGNRIEYWFLDSRMRASNPDSWFARAHRLLQAEDTDEILQVALVSEIGDDVLTTPRAWKILRDRLKNGSYDGVRGQCARGLRRVASHEPQIQSDLLDRFQNDSSEEVRQACAESLAEAAIQDEEVRTILVQTLRSQEAAPVRAGAARGLQKVARKDQTIRQAILAAVSSEEENETVRVSCGWSLEGCLGEDESVIKVFVKLLDDDRAPRLQGCVSQALAGALARGRILWDRGIVERVEHNLMKPSKPCVHALEALQALADARETWVGLRLERVLAESLEESEEDVEIAFVYGSTARLAQNMDSDIDLFVVGDATLKQLSEPLDRAEKTLGRQVNPVIYDRPTLIEKYHAGNPFLQDVLRREKIFVKGAENELRDMVVSQSTRSDGR